eukprot:COSAG06_NODE_49462_length_325_cov_0.849558_1_plen_28_part_10
MIATARRAAQLVPPRALLTAAAPRAQRS